MQLMRLGHSDTGFLVKCNKLADRPGKLAALRLAERIPAGDILKARHKDREAKRVEPRIVEWERIAQRRQRLIPVRCHRLHFFQNGVSQGHRFVPIGWIALRPALRAGQAEESTKSNASGKWSFTIQILGAVIIMTPPRAAKCRTAQN
jgi:hypothetical protein